MGAHPHASSAIWGMPQSPLNILIGGMAACQKTAHSPAELFPKKKGGTCQNDKCPKLQRTLSLFLILFLLFLRVQIQDPVDIVLRRLIALHLLHFWSLIHLREAFFVAL